MTLTVRSVQIYRCFSMIDSENQLFIAPKAPPSPFPTLGLQCQPAHGINSWVLAWLGSESNLVNSPPVQIVLKTDASKSGWGAYRNLVKYIVLVGNGWSIRNQEKTKADLLRKALLLKPASLLPLAKQENKNLTNLSITLVQKVKDGLTWILENRN